MSWRETLGLLRDLMPFLSLTISFSSSFSLRLALLSLSSRFWIFFSSSTIWFSFSLRRPVQSKDLSPSLALQLILRLNNPSISCSRRRNLLSKASLLSPAMTMPLLLLKKSSLSLRMAPRRPERLVKSELPETMMFC